MNRWYERAACREYDTRLWFPETPGTGGAKEAAEAKRICATCPVATPCLAAVLQAERGTLDRRYGIFGGMGPGERLRLERVRLERGAA